MRNSEIIFVPIQTPHGEKFEGRQGCLMKEDFDYSFLKRSRIFPMRLKGQDKIVIIIQGARGAIRREAIL